MTREDLFSLPKSLCLNGTLFKRQTRNVFASENPRHWFAGWSAAQTSSHAVCSETVTALRRRAAPLQRRSISPETWQPRLPTEVWCAIWAWLPFPALIIVTHTCQRWRLAALACTTLWTRPQFHTTVTGHLSLPHIHPYGYRHPAEQPGDVGSANVSWAPAVLARSQNLGLHITLDVPKRGPDLALIADLGITLSLASGRIASITVRAADTDAACALLREMRSLPVLRALIFRSWALADGNYRPHFVSYIPSVMHAPELSTVELAPGFYWPLDGPQFPNVRRISLAPRYDICRELGPALDACPALECLTVDLAARPYYLPVNLGAMLQSRCTALRALRLVNLSASNTELALSIFHSPEIPDVSLSVSQDAPTLGGRIFRDLRAAVRLAVLRHGDHVTVAATDGEGRARRVSCAETAQSQAMPRNEMLHAILREDIDWCNVIMLSVSLSLWDPFVEALPGAPAVTCLRVILPSGRVVYDAKPLDYNPVATREKFPALQMLDIVGAGGAPRMCADDIAAIVRRLDINWPLISLGIDHTIFKGSRAALCELARKVSIRIYAV